MEGGAEDKDQQAVRTTKHPSMTFILPCRPVLAYFCNLARHRLGVAAGNSLTGLNFPDDDGGVTAWRGEEAEGPGGV